MAERLERRFHSVIAENLADTECVLRQHSDDLLQRDDFDVLLGARVFPARRMTSIGHSWFAERLCRRKIYLDHARMERRFGSGVVVQQGSHEDPGVYDDFPLGSATVAANLASKCMGKLSFEVRQTRLIRSSQIAQHCFCLAKPDACRSCLCPDDH
jgi:hypothetical protein